MRIIKVVVCLLLLITSAYPIAAQQERRNQSIYLNLAGGDASVVSLNYDRLFTPTPWLLISGKLGAGWAADSRIFQQDLAGTPAHYLTLPHHATVLLGKDERYYELGLGGTGMILVSGELDAGESPAYKEIYYFFYPLIGCRLQSFGKNSFFVRVYAALPLNGMVPHQTELLFQPVGIATGFSF